MRKLTKKNLAELAELMPRISEIEKRFIVGGGSGTKEDPFTVEEFDSMCDKDTWKGGWVAGQGFVAGQVSVVASGTSDSSGSDSGTWDGLFPDAGMIPPGYWNTPDTTGNLPSGDLSGGMWVSGVWIPNSDTNNGTTGDGGSTGGVNASSDPQKNGLNLDGNNCIRFQMKGNEAFFKQLKSILSGNSQIKQLLVYFDRKYMGITFKVTSMVDDNRLADTTNDVKTLSSIYMAFNSKYVTANGWTGRSTGTDNIEYDWKNVYDNEEALVVVVTHEALHANHYAKVLDAYVECGEDAKKTKDFLLKNKYSKEFVDVFFIEKDGEVVIDTSKGAADKMHAYIAKHDKGIIDNALKEFRDDRDNLNNR